MDKSADWMNKLKNPFKPKFKGQGHRLGAGDDQSKSGASSSGHASISITQSRQPAAGTGGRIATDSAPQQKAMSSNRSPSAGVGDSNLAAGRLHYQQREDQRQQQTEWMQSQHSRWKQDQDPPPSQRGYQAQQSSSGGFGRDNSKQWASQSQQQAPFPSSLGVGPQYLPVPNPRSSSHQGPAMGADASHNASSKIPPGLQVQCPICSTWWRDEAEVADHIDACCAEQEAAARVVPQQGSEKSAKVSSSENANLLPEAGRHLPPANANEGSTDALLPGFESLMQPASQQEAEAVPISEVARSASSRGSKELESLTAVGEADEMFEGDHGTDKDLHHAVAVLMSVSPPSGTLDVLVKLLRNISLEPTVEKFRRVRMGNPRIAATIGTAVGGVEVLQAVGFKLVAEARGEGSSEEVWAVMQEPNPDQVARVKEALNLLEGGLSSSSPLPDMLSISVSKSAGKHEVAPPTPEPVSRPPVKRMADRKVRVFLPASSQQEAARIEIPDSFFNRSAAEVRAEMAARKKMLENSQVLMTRAQRERAAGAPKRVYNTAVMRIQFPDGLVLQGLFYPSEPTSALYEFVAASLQDQSTEFHLAFPFPSKSPFIPFMSTEGLPPPSLEDAGLVPAALIKFRPVDDSPYKYQSLARDLIAAAEPMSSTPLPRGGIP